MHGVYFRRVVTVFLIEGRRLWFVPRRDGRGITGTLRILLSESQRCVCMRDGLCAKHCLRLWQFLGVLCRGWILYVSKAADRVSSASPLQHGYSWGVLEYKVGGHKANNITTAVAAAAAVLLGLTWFVRLFFFFWSH